MFNCLPTTFAPGQGLSGPRARPSRTLEFFGGGQVSGRGSLERDDWWRVQKKVKPPKSEPTHDVVSDSNNILSLAKPQVSSKSTRTSLCVHHCQRSTGPADKSMYDGEDKNFYAAKCLVVSIVDDHLSCGSDYAPPLLNVDQFLKIFQKRKTN